MLTPQSKPSTEELLMAAKDINLLTPIFGGKEKQLRYCQKHINWDRIILARFNGKVVGYLSFFHKGRGPYQRDFRALAESFGYLGAIWRTVFCKLFDLRFILSESYLYHFYVSPDCRNVGLGYGLNHYFRKHLSKLKVKRLKIEVRTTNMSSNTVIDKAYGDDIRRKSLAWVSYFLPFKLLSYKVRLG